MWRENAEEGPLVVKDPIDLNIKLNRSVSFSYSLIRVITVFALIASLSAPPSSYAQGFFKSLGFGGGNSDNDGNNGGNNKGGDKGGGYCGKSQAAAGGGGNDGGDGSTALGPPETSVGNHRPGGESRGDDGAVSLRVESDREAAARQNEHVRIGTNTGKSAIRALVDSFQINFDSARNNAGERRSFNQALQDENVINSDKAEFGTNKTIEATNPTFLGSSNGNYRRRFLEVNQSTVRELQSLAQEASGDMKLIFDPLIDFVESLPEGMQNDRLPIHLMENIDLESARLVALNIKRLRVNFPRTTKAGRDLNQGLDALESRIRDLLLLRMLAIHDSLVSTDRAYVIHSQKPRAQYSDEVQIVLPDDKRIVDFNNHNGSRDYDSLQGGYARNALSSHLASEVLAPDRAATLPNFLVGAAAQLVAMQGDVKIATPAKPFWKIGKESSSSRYGVSAHYLGDNTDVSWNDGLATYRGAFIPGKGRETEITGYRDNSHPLLLSGNQHGYLSDNLPSHLRPVEENSIPVEQDATKLGELWADFDSAHSSRLDFTPSGSKANDDSDGAGVVRPELAAPPARDLADDGSVLLIEATSPDETAVVREAPALVTDEANVASSGLTAGNAQVGGESTHATASEGGNYLSLLEFAHFNDIPAPAKPGNLSDADESNVHSARRADLDPMREAFPAWDSDTHGKFAISEFGKAVAQARESDLQGGFEETQAIRILTKQKLNNPDFRQSTLRRGLEELLNRAENSPDTLLPAGWKAHFDHLVRMTQLHDHSKNMTAQDRLQSLEDMTAFLVRLRTVWAREGYVESIDTAALNIAAKIQFWQQRLPQHRFELEMLYHELAVLYPDLRQSGVNNFLLANTSVGDPSKIYRTVSEREMHNPVERVATLMRRSNQRNRPLPQSIQESLFTHPGYFRHFLEMSNRTEPKQGSSEHRQWEKELETSIAFVRASMHYFLNPSPGLTQASRDLTESFVRETLLGEGQSNWMDSQAIQRLKAMDQDIEDWINANKTTEGGRQDNTEDDDV